VFQQPTLPVTVQPVVAIKAPAPTAVPVAQAQPSGSIIGNNEVYISATCSPQDKVNPQFNWTIAKGSDQVKLDSQYTGGPTMGVIGIKGGTTNEVTVSVTCKDLNTDTTSPPQTIKMTAQQPGSLSIVAPDNTSLNSCPTGQCGAQRQFTYQVNDTNGAPMVFGGLDFWDYITTGSPNNCSLNSYNVTCSNSVASGRQTGNCDSKANTTSSGQFNETLTVCSLVCGSVSNGKCTGSCSTEATQTWIVNGYAVTKSLTYQCGSVSVQ
jgi:hypothetical protein